MQVTQLSVLELKKMSDEGQEFQLIDVREPHEYEICNLGGALIPLGEIHANVDEIARDMPVVIHCHKGGRSAQAIMLLQMNFGFDNLINLEGGIAAWADQIDPSMPKY